MIDRKNRALKTQLKVQYAGARKIFDREVQRAKRFYCTRCNAALLKTQRQTTLNFGKVFVKSE